MRYKRQIFRISVFLVFLFLIITLLSGTIYRLSWAQVCAGSVTAGKLDQSVCYNTIIVPPRENIAGAGLDKNSTVSDESITKLRQGVYLSMSFDELALIKRYEVYGEITISMLTSMMYQSTVVAELTYVDFTYNNTTGKFDVYFMVDPKTTAYPGFPIRIIFRPKTDVDYMKLVPCDSVFPENTDKIRYYIYAISEEKSLWGKSNRLEKIEVQVLAGDYQHVAIAFVDNTVPTPKLVACSPSKTLYDGDRVQVTGAS